MFAMFPTRPQITMTATEKGIWLRTTREGPEQYITLNSPVSTEVFGISIKDWLARFENPSRMLISFTAPNGGLVRATQSSSERVTSPACPSKAPHNLRQFACGRGLRLKSNARSKKRI